MGENKKKSQVLRSAVQRVLYYYLEKRSLTEVLKMLSDDVISVGFGKDDVSLNRSEMEDFLRNRLQKMPGSVHFVQENFSYLECAPQCYICYVKFKVYPEDIITTVDIRMTIGLRFEGASFKVFMVHVTKEDDNEPKGSFIPVYYTKKSEGDFSKKFQSELYNIINEVIPCGFVATSMKQGFRVLAMNDIFLNMLGYTHDELLDETDGNIEELIHPRDYLYVYENMMTCFVENKVCRAECRLRRKDGDYLWVYFVAHSIIMDDNSMAQISTLIDISKNISIKNYYFHDATKRLRIMDSLYPEFADIIYVDLDQNVFIPYILAERIEKELHLKKYHEEPLMELVDRCISKYVISEEQSIFRQAIQWEVMQRELDKNGKYYIHFRTNAFMPNEHLQICIMSIEDNRHQIWACRSIENVFQEEQRQRKALEEALQQAKKAEQAKTRFLFNISHDIRTPMNAIMGFNALAQKNSDNQERVLDALKKSEIASQYLLNLINDVLEMARIENGRITIEEQLINVEEYYEEITEVFKYSMQERDINFVTENVFTHPHVYLDGTRVMQVLMNLLGNAQKFTNPGGTVRYSSYEIPSEELGFVEFEIRIKDNGIGMSNEFQERLFEAFEREQTTTDRATSGTGLGLSIAKSIAELMHGTLTCESAIGKGTEFIFRFPARVANDCACMEQVTVPEVDQEQTVIDYTSKRLLVVDDNALNREIAKEILLDFGFNIELAENGLIAYERVKNAQPGYYDVILMDVQMPYMDGYTATAEIRQLDNVELANIPIIAMTANAFEEDRKHSVEAGMNAHLAKPLDVQKLVEALNQYLD